MKQIFSLLLLLTSINMFSQSSTHQIVPTQMGHIAVHINEVPETVPILFLHGVYFDHRLWDSVLTSFPDHTTITVDMPLHGESNKEVPATWTLEECGAMVIELLDSLEISKTYAIGHSWGSMSILRAAHHSPHRFEAIGLCNMPFEASMKATQRRFRLQHSLLFVRGFYTKQVAKALYGKESLKQTPQLFDLLAQSMGKLSNADVKTIDRMVIIEATDASHLCEQLEVPALALKGKEDYVSSPPGIDTFIIEGGHVSPVEQPQEVIEFIQRITSLTPSLGTR